jgi:hypothetical protein
MAMAGGVPGIVVLALGAGALGGPDALRLLFALAGWNPAVDIGICVFVICMFAAMLLGNLLLARYVRKVAPPPAGGAGAGRGAPGAAPAADPLACITLLLCLAAASLITACLVSAAAGPGSVRLLVDFAAKYCYAIAIAAGAGAGAALLYGMPLLRVFREQRNARGRAAPAERAATTPHAPRFFSGLPLVIAAACALLVAIPGGARCGLDASRLSPGYSNTPVAVVVGSVHPLVDFAAKYSYPITIAVTAAATATSLFLLRVFRGAAPAERDRTVHHVACFIGGLNLVAAACALLVTIAFGAHGSLDALRFHLGLANMLVAVAVPVGATLLVLVHFYGRARNAAAAASGGRGDAAAAPRTRRASASG